MDTLKTLETLKEQLEELADSHFNRYARLSSDQIWRTEAAAHLQRAEALKEAAELVQKAADQWLADFFADITPEDLKRFTEQAQEAA